MLAVISDTVWLSAIPASASLISTIVLAFIQMRTRNAVVEGNKSATYAAGSAAEKVEGVRATAERAAEAVEVVKETLQTSSSATEQKLKEIAKVSVDTHTLVNSNMAAQLKISAVALRRVAQLTNHPDDDAAASLAEKLLREHEGKQGIVDNANK